MARATNRLTAPEVRAFKVPGRYADGGGLYLVVDKSGAKRWAFLFRWRDRRLEMGLGGVGSVSLSTARDKARDAREALSADINPIDARNALKAIPTFGELADEVIATKAAGFRRDKSAAIWRRALKDYASDLGPIRVDNIDTAAVMKVLKPMWADKPESAHKARGCIEAVLDAAKAKGHRSGENPARWKGQLDHLLPKRRKLSRGHLKAMPYAEVTAFVKRLRERPALAARALEFTILTAARTDEVLGATWAEIDTKAKVWTLAADRMKGAREHRIALSERALAVLGLVCPEASRDPAALVFPGPNKRGSVVARKLSSNAMLALLGRMDADVTVHGFRSAFRDWAGEVSPFPRELAEQALSHVVGDETERAYRRGDALEKRRKLMEAWAAYIEHGGKADVGPVLRVVAK